VDNSSICRAQLSATEKKFQISLARFSNIFSSLIIQSDERHETWISCEGVGETEDQGNREILPFTFKGMKIKNKGG